MTTPTETKRKRGRPISPLTPVEKKQLSLEEEAREFFSQKVREEEATTGNVEGLSLLNFYAGSALSGLLASGKYNRADELVDEAFRYAALMVRNQK